MSTISADTTVGALVADRLGRARVFQEYGIDFCCGGKRPLREACESKGVPVERVLAALQAADAESVRDRDPGEMGLAELADHVVEAHHRTLQRELPRLGAMLAKVIAVHGDRHPELAQCGEVFNEIRTEMQQHMLKEEQVLFPMIRKLESAGARPGGPFGSIENPIRMMEHEHDSTGHALATLRSLTHGFVPPVDACTTYRVLLDGLAEMERDLHLHVHKENNVLFPRAIAAERQLAAQPN